ncbi:MAG TPA: DUF1579 family protein [Candidatus Acidoferrales bacterium]|nr:DUF1579 family protein [Candidatus Acidoferrales bacterium]
MRRCTILLVSIFTLGLCVADAQAQTPPASPKPGPEAKKMAAFVGKFHNEGEMKAGVMGPNSPAGKITGTDDCKWAAGGFAVVCSSATGMGGMKSTSTSMMYYDPQTKMYHYQEVDSTGDVSDATGTVDGETWTWNGKGNMGGHTMYSRFTMKMLSKDSFEWTMAAGDRESSMEQGMSGKETRITAAAKRPTSKAPSQ